MLGTLKPRFDVVILRRVQPFALTGCASEPTTNVKHGALTLKTMTTVNTREP